MSKAKWDGPEGEGSQRREGAKQLHRQGLKTRKERWSGRKKLRGTWGEDPVGHSSSEGDDTQMFWLSQKQKPGGWPRRLFIITKTSNKTREMNLKRKKHQSSHPFPAGSYCSISPVAQWPGCRHQIWWEAEHNLLTHPQEEQGKPPDPSSPPCYRAPEPHQAQKAEAKSWNKTESFEHLCRNSLNES